VLPNIKSFCLVPFFDNFCKFILFFRKVNSSAVTHNIPCLELLTNSSDSLFSIHYFMALIRLNFPPMCQSEKVIKYLKQIISVHNSLYIYVKQCTTCKLNKLECEWGSNSLENQVTDFLYAHRLYVFVVLSSFKRHRLTL